MGTLDMSWKFDGKLDDGMVSLQEGMKNNRKRGRSCNYLFALIL